MASSGQPWWGVAASGKGDVTKAGKVGASWVVVTHGGGLDPAVPASAAGLLPFANANAEVALRRTLATEEHMPVLAGVFAPDQFSLVGHLLRDLRRAGFGGVQNFPSVGLAEGRFEAFLHESGMDYDREIEMARHARELDLFVSAVVFTPEQADAMALAGADMMVFHPGLNADGEYRGRSAATLRRFGEIAAAARRRSPGILLARMAFEDEAFAGIPEDIPHGIQYDRNI